MLRKANRLKKEKDFRRVLREKKSFREGFLILKYVSNRGQKTRIGISVSRKISKKATLRNKQKRRLAALARQQLSQIKKGLDVFLIALPGIELQTFSEIKETCQKLFCKARILDNNEKNFTINN